MFKQWTSIILVFAFALTSTVTPASASLSVHPPIAPLSSIFATQTFVSPAIPFWHSFAGIWKSRVIKLLSVGSLFEAMSHAHHFVRRGQEVVVVIEKFTGGAQNTPGGVARDVVGPGGSASDIAQWTDRIMTDNLKAFVPGGEFRITVDAETASRLTGDSAAFFQKPAELPPNADEAFSMFLGDRVWPNIHETPYVLGTELLILAAVAFVIAWILWTEGRPLIRAAQKMKTFLIHSFQRTKAILMISSQRASAMWMRYPAVRFTGIAAFAWSLAEPFLQSANGSPVAFEFRDVVLSIVLGVGLLGISGQFTRPQLLRWRIRATNFGLTARSAWVRMDRRWNVFLSVAVLFAPFIHWGPIDFYVLVLFMTGIAVSSPALWEKIYTTFPILSPSLHPTSWVFHRRQFQFNEKRELALLRVAFRELTENPHGSFADLRVSINRFQDMLIEAHHRVGRPLSPVWMRYFVEIHLARESMRLGSEFAPTPTVFAPIQSDGEWTWLVPRRTIVGIRSLIQEYRDVLPMPRRTPIRSFLTARGFPELLRRAALAIALFTGVDAHPEDMTPALTEPIEAHPQGERNPNISQSA